MTPAAAPPSLVKRALAGHASIGLLVGALIYLLCLTGTMVVIHDRWQRWEQPNIVETGEHFSPKAAQSAMAAAIAREPKGAPRLTHLYIRMPTADLPRAVVTTEGRAWYVDSTGRVVGREAHHWTEFVIALHEYLTLPIGWGMIVVGALGVALAALSVTGIVAHPRIIRDAFRLRTRHDPQLARADWHNRLGVWTLPFALAIALTGAILGLSSIGSTLLARHYTGGDLEKIYAPIFGGEPAPDLGGAPLPDIAAALTDVARRAPAATPTYVVVHDPGTKGQFVQILAEYPRRLIYGEAYGYDGSGRFLGAAGLSDGPIGQQATASTYNLHFGNFAGLPVEIAYILLGAASCVVCATGTTLWLRKRQRRGLRSDRLQAAWTVAIWGSPLAIIVSYWLRVALGPDAPLTAAFWIVLAIALLGAMLRPIVFDSRHLATLLMLALPLSAISHMIVNRPTTADVIAIDAILFLMGTAPLAYRLARRDTSKRLHPA